jgi:hypothetical protein
MASAREVLDATVREAALLANTEATIDQVRPLLNLARDALDAGDGELPDEQVRESGIHPSVLTRLGIS